MTTLQELNDYTEKELQDNRELLSKIHDQSISTIAELIDDEPELNKNNATEYALCFCLGAVWAISQNLNHQTK